MSRLPHDFAAIFTDGSCSGTGKGGWANIVAQRGGLSYNFGTVAHTTSYRCEIYGIVDGLWRLQDSGRMPSTVLILSDNQSVVEVISGQKKAKASTELFVAVKHFMSITTLLPIWIARQSGRYMTLVDAMAHAAYQEAKPLTQLDLNRLVGLDALNPHAALTSAREMYETATCG